MDVITLLRDDHEHIQALIDELDATTQEGEMARVKLYDDIRFEMVQHMDGEEAVFYPELRRFDETRHFVERAVMDHSRVRELMDELDGIDPTDAAWLPAFDRLKEEFLVHVAEEESDVFPKAQRLLAQSRAEVLAENIILDKERRLPPAERPPTVQPTGSRPH